jgi:acyl transferase domain-containing protein/NADPH:quinone reductase-like Zn-dependent oxidoreductase/NAD(P)-dependent dehydrogenase (short-subunit alcohol dehydrogenase family)
MAFGRTKAREPIAIVGAAARLPGANSLDAYWDLLAAGRDAVTEIPDGRWSKRFYFHPNPRQPGKSYTWAAGVLEDIEGFDAAFFGISPREAEQVDPQQRLLLELAWEALEDAGIPSRALAGGEAGVYVGFSSAEYANIRMGDPSGADAYFMTGTTASITANRISYVFDLHGPSVVMDTACSSSLVALAQACRALDAGEVPLALVGAANMLLSPYPYVGFCRASMLSPTGRCQAFDARADGYVRAEGGGMVVLKRLSDAERDGDDIRGLILGSGVNSDGRTAGLSLPSGAAQAQLLRQVYAQARVEPDELAFIEAHGTGTAVGDPIELGAIGSVLGQPRAAPLPVGSAKTNIGHLETAAGMAGLLKSMLSLERRALPASLHFETPNPAIDFEALNVRVSTALTDLAPSGRLIAGVNSFGFGGTNAHVILASPPPPPEANAPAGLAPLLISARSKAALGVLAESWREQLIDAPQAAAELAQGAARRRDHHRHRLWVAGDSAAELVAGLDPASAESITGEAVQGALAFVFSGNGSQWAGMGAEALRLNPAFRRGVARADAALAAHLGWSVLERLEGDPADQDLARTDIAQPLLFAVQVGVVESLRASGVEAQAFVGHSVGEIAAAWASGALSLEAAARVVTARSRGQQRTRGLGGMAAIKADAAACAQMLSDLGVDLAIAAVNSPSSVTVAGPIADLERLEDAAARRGWTYRRLDIEYPFHTAAMDSLRHDLLADLAGLEAGASETFVSTVTGAPTGSRRLDPDYWWRNIREPVAFGPAVAHLIGSGVGLFLEVGPAAILQGYLREALGAAQAEGAALQTLTRTETGRDPFPAIAGALYVRGYDLAGSGLFEGAAAVRGLPRHPWTRARFWSDPTQERIPIAAPAGAHPLLGFRWEADGRAWKALVDLELQPWLADHAVEGVPVLPAAAVLELALAAGQDIFGDAGLEVRDLEISRALVIEAGRTREVRLRVDAGDRFLLESRARLAEDPWLIHASGRLSRLGAGPLPIEPPQTGVAADVAGLYDRARELGLEYGESFRVISALTTAADEAFVRFGAAELGDGFLLAPNLVDGAFQALLALAPDDSSGVTMLPWRIGQARAFAPLGRRPASARIRLKHRGVRAIEGEVRLFDAAGAPVAELEQCWFRRTRLNRKPDVQSRVLRMTSVPAPLDPGEPSPAGALAGAWSGVSSRTAAPTDSGLMLRAYLIAALAQDLRKLADGRLDVEALVAEGRVAPDSADLLSGLLAELAASGLATSSADGWTIGDTDGFGDPARIGLRLLEDEPALGPVMVLAVAAIARLRRVLAEGPAGPAALPAALLAQALHQSPAGQLGREALLSRLEALCRNWPKSHPLRILELGADTGMLTRQALRRLRAGGVALSYVASDPDPGSVAALSFEFAGAPGVETLAWPLAENDRSFDIIIGCQASLRGVLDGQIAASLSRLLAPSGVLLVCEPAPSLLWDIVGGQGGVWATAPVWSGGATLPIATAEDLVATPWGLRLTTAIRPRAGSVAAPILDTRGWAVAGGGAPAITAALVLRGVRRIADLDGEAAVSIWAAGVDDLVVAPDTGDAVEALAQVLDAARAAQEAGARLWLLTQGAWDGSPAAAAVWGLGRTLVNEAPELDCRMIDVAAAIGAADAADALLAEAARCSREREVLLTADGRRVIRLQKGSPASAEGAASVRLDVAEPGRLDSLRWLGSPDLPTAADGEVVVEVRAAALNFRDLMWVIDLLPEEALRGGFTGPTLGLECAGVVISTGTGVDEVAVGDRVMAFAPGALASHIRTEPRALVKLPEGLSDREAATLPVAYMTAIYSLETVARLSAGEWVLIHAAAGGVGLAAIRYAQHVGARVIATAGSEAKRELLRTMGVEHVLDSRSLAFGEEVRRICGGVDVVLNSLSGAAMELSLELMAPFGRFVELGKRDYFEDTRVGLRALRRNVSYFAVDVDALPTAKPDLARSLLERVVAMVGEGVLSPLPYVTFGFSEAQVAFRLMQASGQVGKILLIPDAPPVAAEVAGPAIRADGTYLVTGGLGGFGLATARWLAGRGAKHLVLLSRQGPATPSAAQVLAAFASWGVDARAVACDVADRAQLGRALDQVRATMPPLRGVIHAATVVDDGLALDLDRTRLRGALAAKLGGAENLDALTAADPLDIFLLYSSAVTLLGAPGQGAYVAANHGLETLARRRRAQGRPALAVGWGPILDAGLLARNPAAREALARRLAVTPLGAAEALDALAHLLSGDEAAPAYAVVQWDQARKHLAILASPIFEALDGAAAVGEQVDLARRLTELSPSEAREMVTGVLVEEVARILGATTDEVDRRRPLIELGMDSLMALELRVALEARLSVSLPLLAMSDPTNLASLADRIIESLSQPAAPSSAAAEAALRHEGPFEAPATPLPAALASE